MGIAVGHRLRLVQRGGRALIVRDARSLRTGPAAGALPQCRRRVGACARRREQICRSHSAPSAAPHLRAQRRRHPGVDAGGLGGRCRRAGRAAGRAPGCARARGAHRADGRDRLEGPRPAERGAHRGGIDLGLPTDPAGQELPNVTLFIDDQHERHRVSTFSCTPSAPTVHQPLPMPSGRLGALDVVVRFPC